VSSGQSLTIKLMPDELTEDVLLDGVSVYDWLTTDANFYEILTLTNITANHVVTVIFN